MAMTDAFQDKTNDQDIFDESIAEIREWLAGKAGDKQLKTHSVSASQIETLNRKRVRENIILKEDTHLELGHPSVGSCSAALTTHDPTLVEDDRVTLLGPDVPEISEQQRPFAQIILAAIKGEYRDTAPLEDMSSRMDRIAHRSANTKGYMVRSVPNLIWSRVSKEAAQAGFSILELGSRLVAALKQECPEIVNCEVLFVTSEKADVEALDDICETARAKIRKLETFKRGPDGEYECTQEQDCNVCPEQVVCDNIRDVIKIRKGDRIITFGEEVTVETF
jgi:CO dehydrogenase/acetyl-CoA synthase beta subunit